MNIENKEGAALVEMAIILPLLFLIVFGIFEFGRAMVMTNSLTNAAREGARRAAVSPPPIDVDEFVRSAIPFRYEASELIITPEPTSPTPGSGSPIRITVTLPFHTVTNFIPALNDITLRGQASMRYEYTGP